LKNEEEKIDLENSKNELERKLQDLTLQLETKKSRRQTVQITGNIEKELRKKRENHEDELEKMQEDLDREAKEIREKTDKEKKKLERENKEMKKNLEKLERKLEEKSYPIEV